MIGEALKELKKAEMEFNYAEDSDYTDIAIHKVAAAQLKLDKIIKEAKGEKFVEKTTKELLEKLDDLGLFYNISGNENQITSRKVSIYLTTGNWYDHITKENGNGVDSFIDHVSQK